MGPPKTARVRPSWTATVAGFVLAGALLFVLLSIIGIEDVLATLAGVEPAMLALVVGVALAWMGAWSVTLFLVLDSLGVEATRPRAFLLFSTMQFVDNVVPFSVVGSQPLSTLLIARGTDAPYETSFVAVGSVGVVNFLPAPVLALSGALYFAATASLGGALGLVVVSLVAMFLAIGLVGVVAWRYRRQVTGIVLGFIVGLEARLASVIPWVDRSNVRSVERRTGSISDGIALVLGDRRGLALGAVASTVGWLCFCGVLWASFVAVGHPIPFAVALFVVPLVTVTDLVPLPGGLGSLDATLVVLLVALAGVPATVATAGVIVHRAATYLLPVVVGASAVALVQFT